MASATLSRRQFLAATAALSLDSSAGGTVLPPILTPEQFGAVGDGETNDTSAFQALAAAINREGGGVVRLRSGATYIVGRQNRLAAPRDGYTFEPERLLHFVRCQRPITIEGNGATLRAPAGYRYGTFDLRGRPTRHRQPYFGPELAAGYHAFIEFEQCSGTMLVRDLSLDGNIARARIGGGWDATGWQIPGCGLIFRNNRGRWRCQDVRSYRHGLDGLYVDEPGTATTAPSGSGTERCDFFENGRQAMSLVGGVGLEFRTTKFRRTHRGLPVQSLPGAGVDLEAEGGKIVRAIRFDNCEFTDNGGAALVHGGGPVSDVLINESLLVGTTNWTWYGAGAKRVRFVRSQLAGAVINLEGGAGATVFEDCLLTNDPAFAIGGRAPFSPSGFLIPDAKAGAIFRRGEIRHAIAAAGINGNLDAMTIEGTIIRATAGSLIVYGRCRSGCRFVEDGGRIAGLPDGVEGRVPIGAADDGWSLTSRGVTRSFRASRRPISQR